MYDKIRCMYSRLLPENFNKAAFAVGRQIRYCCCTSSPQGSWCGWKLGRPTVQMHSYHLAVVVVEVGGRDGRQKRYSSTAVRWTLACWTRTSSTMYSSIRYPFPAQKKWAWLYRDHEGIDTRSTSQCGKQSRKQQ